MRTKKQNNRGNGDAVFAAKFKAIRLSRDWTLAKMAEILELHESTIWKIENNESVPQERIKARIVRTFPELGK